MTNELEEIRRAIRKGSHPSSAKIYSLMAIAYCAGYTDSAVEEAIFETYKEVVKQREIDARKRDPDQIRRERLLIEIGIAIVGCALGFAIACITRNL